MVVFLQVVGSIKIHQRPLKKQQHFQSLYSLTVFRMGSPSSDLKVRCDDEDQLMEVSVLTVAKIMKGRDWN